MFDLSSLIPYYVKQYENCQHLSVFDLYKMAIHLFQPHSYVALLLSFLTSRIRAVTPTSEGASQEV